jgi:hypothetical protein
MVGYDILCLKVQQHFWGNNTGMAEVNEGETGKEIVYGMLRAELRKINIICPGYLPL